jgi:hypothetical protein
VAYGISWQCSPAVRISLQPILFAGSGGTDASLSGSAFRHLPTRPVRQGFEMGPRPNLVRELCLLVIGKCGISPLHLNRGTNTKTNKTILYYTILHYTILYYTVAILAQVQYLAQPPSVTRVSRRGVGRVGLLAICSAIWLEPPKGVRYCGTACIQSGCSPPFNPINPPGHELGW